MLEGIRVVDTCGRLGWLAGRLLADLGAEVVRVETPGAEVSGAEWRALNVNKTLLWVDPLDVDGRRTLERLVAAADILLATPDGDAALDYPRLLELHPELIVVAITSFGLEGPKAKWRASDLEIMAAGGAMSLAGEPGGEPLRVSAPQAGGWAGAHAVVGALTALAARARTGRGDLVDVSAQAAVLAALAHAPAFYDMLGTTPTRAGAHVTGRSVSNARYRVFWPCRDGYLTFILYGGPAGRRTNEALVGWMRERGCNPGPLGEIEWAEFDATRATQQEVDAIEEPIAAFFAQLTKREFLEGAHAREMLGYPVSTVEDIAADPQLEARAFWQEVPAADGRTERHCGCFVVVDGVRPPVRVRQTAGTPSGRTP
jgi:crotonobetainyl-CoA:carnitine CoA-transferase CaiB-like acyl-CoA transferase